MSDASDLSPTAPLSPAAPSQSAPPAPPSRAEAPIPGSKAWTEMSPAQRHEQLRGPPNPRAHGHSPAIEQREAAAARAGGEPDPAAGDPADPQAAPAASAEKVKIGRYEVSEAELATMMDRQAQDDLRKATLPPTPDDYKLELTPGAKLPGETEYKLDTANPSLVALKNWAHGKGFDQSTLSEMLTIYASHEAAQNATLAERLREEITKTGVNGPQRVDAVTRWVTAEVGADAARPIVAGIFTAAHLEFYERIMHKINSQGSASFSQQHRVAPDTSEIPGYANMSFAQRRQAQDQFAARRR